MTCPSSFLPSRKSLELLGAFGLGLVLTPHLARAQTPVEPEPLIEPLSVHPPSRMRAFTSTPDGRWLFLSEGGTMVFADMYDETLGAFTDAALKSPDGSKRVTTGSLAVLANDLLLDPTADSEPGDNSSGVKNLLYVAAGRDGLWVMEADVNSTENQAWRVDDSGNTNPGSQSSRRWCADVEWMRVGGVDYVVALFARKDGNRVRVYEADRIRALADPANANPELGVEIAADYQTAIGDRPGAPANTYGHAVGLALEVDEYVDSGTGEEWADVYVALAQHGLVKIEYRPGSMGATKAWGPTFGDGTAYTTDVTKSPASKTTELYESYRYELTQEFHEQAVVERIEAPVFTDVAVFRGQLGGSSVRQLYATVDHLNWVLFDLNDAWADDMVIHHHEGEQVDDTPANGFLVRHWVRPVYGPGGQGCTRALELVDHPVHGPHLIVTTGAFSLLKDYSQTTTEGFAYDRNFNWGGGGATGAPSKQRTLWYPLQTASAYSDTASNYQDEIAFGGDRLFAPTVQDLPDRLKVYHSYRVLLSGSDAGAGTCLSLVALTTSATPKNFVREVGDSLGRMCFKAMPSFMNPDVVLTSHNDGSIPKDGFLVSGVDPDDGTYKTLRHYVGPGGDDRGPDDLLVDYEAQWVADEASNHQWVLSGGKAPNPDGGSSSDTRHLLLKLLIPDDPFDTSPDRVKGVYFKALEDRFQSPGRTYYQAGYMSREFDAFVDGEPVTEKQLYVTNQRTQEGLWVYDREEVIAAFDQAQPDEDEDLPPLLTSQALVTHPEFNFMENSNTDLEDWWRQANTPDAVQDVTSWLPRLIEVDDPSSSQVEDRSWVMAVPCGEIHADPDWDVFSLSYPGNPGDGDTDGYNDWLHPEGSIWRDKFGHGLVQFFEMKPDPTRGGQYWPETVVHLGRDQAPGGGDDVGGNSPLSKVVAPDSGGRIWRLESMTTTDPQDGSKDVYLFCADFGGRVYVHSIDDVLTYTDPEAALPGPFASWSSPPALFDDLPSAVFDIAIDYRGGQTALVYVAVRRVGVVVLNFEPGAANPLDRLVEVGRIQTAEYAASVHVRERVDGSGNPTGVRDLIVSDYGGGIRFYGEE